MRLERKHGQTQAIAIQKIDAFLEKLMKQNFPGITIKNPEKRWLGSTMTFSFGVKKGMLMHTTVTGSIQVTDTTAIANSELGPIARQFVSEEQIASAVDKAMKEVFG